LSLFAFLETRLREKSNQPTNQPNTLTHTHTHTHTHTQTDRQTDTHTHTHINKNTHPYTHRYASTADGAGNDITPLCFSDATRIDGAYREWYERRYRIASPTYVVLY
jgi:hypothetical protein